jgi:putative oxidoreductase
MNAFLSLGRWFFALPFAIFGLLHFMNADMMAELSIPPYMPAKTLWVYLTGTGLIAAAVAMIIGKYDKLAATFLAIFLVLMVILLHVPAAMSGGSGAQASMASLLKDISLAGGAMMYALHYAQDRSVIG